MVKRINKKHLLSFLIVCVIITALISPLDYIAGTLSAFILYAKNVLPALFPFIFFNKMLTMIGSATELSMLLKKPLEKIYHAPAITGYVMIMSIFCGYPIGSKLTRDLYNSGAINKQSCFIISVLSNVCGPIFIIGTISSMFGSTKVGYIIYIAHLLSTFLNGFVYRPKQKQLNTACNITTNYDDILSKSMIDSIISIATVGGYIAIMSFIITLSDKIELTNLVVSIFNNCGVDGEVTKSVWYGLFEMTRGLANLSYCHLSYKISIPIATFIVTFGGACIALQSLNYTAKCGVTVPKYLLSKLSQAIIATLISVLIVLAV